MKHSVFKVLGAAEVELFDAVSHTIEMNVKSGDDRRAAHTRRIFHAFAAILLLNAAGASSLSAENKPTGTQIVLLGTGTPLPDPARAGPCTAIVVNGIAYLVDLGTAVVRRAAAARNKGVTALEPTNLKMAFLSHLHSD